MRLVLQVSRAMRGTPSPLQRRRRALPHVALVAALALALTLMSADVLRPRRGSWGIARGVAAAAVSPPPARVTETELIAVDLGHDSMKVSGWRVQQLLQQQSPEGGVAPVDAAAPAAAAAAATTTGSVVMMLNDQTNRKSPPCIAMRSFRIPPGGAAATAASQADPPLHPRGYELERTFAEQAQALAPRFPSQVVCSAAQLLGQTAATMTEDEEQQHQQLGYHVQPLSDAAADAAPTTETRRRALGVFVPFFATGGAATAAAPPTEQQTQQQQQQRNDGVVYSAEELTAMLLGYARRMGEKSDAADNAIDGVEEEEDEWEQQQQQQRTPSVSNGTVAAAVTRYAALTVPVHASVAQRQALVDAAALAGLRVVRLVHSTTAAAVQLAHMRGDHVLSDGAVQHVMIYDVGSMQAEVAVYRFAGLTPSLASRAGVRGSVELLALVSRRTLGGAAFDRCIAERWDARYFGGRVLRAGAGAQQAKERASLLRAAQQAKEMLSAHHEAHVTIDGVRGDVADLDAAAQEELRQRHVTLVADGGALTVRLTRATFEDWCRPLLDDAVALRDEALAATHGAVATVAALDRLEVIGGGTRVPRLLQRLGDGYKGSTVDRTLNSDEAAVMGAALLAVSSAPRTLRLRGGNALPRYRMREWLISDVYVAVGAAASAAAAPAVPLQRVFAAVSTLLPATSSVRLRLPDTHDNTTDEDDTVALVLLSGVEVDRAYASGARADVVTSACTGCYVRRCIVSGARRAVAQLLLQQQQQQQPQQQQDDAAQDQQRHRVVTAEVVVEVVATVSGIPHCSAAYLRAEVEAPAATAAAAVAVADAVEVSSLSVERGEDASGDDGEDAAAAEAAEAATRAPSNEQQQQQRRRVHITPLSLRIHSGGDGAAVAGYNMNEAERAASRRRVAALQAIDDARLQRSTLRNRVESALVWVKENCPAWDTDAAPAEAAAVVRETGTWLDDHGDTASVAALEERLRNMTRVKAALRHAAAAAAAAATEHE
ncbi:HSP70-like protein [Novymonas esmeraldas]|uniref:HSP70-like protein n=1 Tax=Novymonas esmeraldas TaxID=1808958 RepID=A0AAW0EN94_9TRYP